MAEKTPERSNLFFLVIIFSGIILIGTALVLVFALLYGRSVSGINNFDDCAAAGYPILESYPERCRTPDGRTFVREIEEPVDEGDQSPEEQSESEDYYGRSTNYSCTSDADCMTSGCGMEICQGKAEEPLVSICIDTGEPNPTEAGYSCGCINNGCAWKK